LKLYSEGESSSAASKTSLRGAHSERSELLTITPIEHSEDNWQLGRIGDQSLDVLAGSLQNMFHFNQPENSPLILDPATDEIKSDML
jgi:hypothetical protein